MAEKQDKCLVNKEGWRFMHIYDTMPSEVRERLQEIPANLCAACVRNQFNIQGRQGIDGYMRAIDEMLAQLGYHEVLTPRLASIVAELKKKSGFRRI